MTPVPGVYFDTSVFIAAMLGQGEPSYEAATTALQAAEQGSFRGVASALVIAEVVGAPRLRAPQGVPQVEARRRMDRAIAFFETFPFTYVEIGRREGIRAAQIARQWDMKGPDALHLALAESAGCGEFHSLDRDHLKVGSEIPGLIVREPHGFAQQGLPLEE